MKEIIKNFNKLLNRHQKNRLLILVAISIIGAFLEILGVSLMIPMVTAIMQPDIIETNDTIKKVCDIFGLSSHRSFVLLCIIALIVLFIVKNLYLLFEYYIQARFVFNNRFQTQKQVFHAYLCRSYEFFLNANSSEILRDINGNVQETYDLLLILLFLVTESFISLALIVTVLIVDPVMMTSIVIMMAILILVIIRKIKPILSKKGDESRENYAISYRWILQVVEGIKEVKVTHKESFFEDEFTQSAKKTVSAMKWQSVLGNVPRLLIEAGCVCSTLTVIAVMIYYGKPMEALFPTLAAFAMAAVKLMPSANRIVTAMNAVSFHGPALKKLVEIIDYLGESNDNIVDAGSKIDIKEKIELKGITYSYPNTDVNVLENADMVIPVGTSVGIVGKSGSGKTTAVDVLLGLLIPKSGTITVDGINVMDNYTDWLRHLGYIPQSVFMLNDTIRGNVVFGNKPDDEKVWKALEDAQLADFVNSLPRKLDTNIGERGIRLSGGQRQRLGIARALYNDPEILIFDEATSSLDGETEKAIMESINGLHGKKTMIIIAHRLQTIEKCDDIYKVQDGKIVRG